MDRNDNIYDLLNEYLDIGEEGICLLEEQIDSDTQLEYFEYSKNQEKTQSAEEVFQQTPLIFDQATSEDHKKKILVQLASLDDVEAYRTIEKYLRQPNSKLYEWAYLALQESRLLLESKFLEENKVLITTGLGGKGLKLRYFIVLFTSDGSNLTDLQKKIISSELQYTLGRKGAEIEHLHFEDGFASVLTVVPIRVPVQRLFDKVVRELQTVIELEFGDFLFNDYIITNVKILNLQEIRELLSINNII